MIWRIAAYAVALAAAAFLLTWLDYLEFARTFSREAYVVVIATAFAGLGAWLAAQLMPVRDAGPFAKNDAALKSLGVTDREYAVLELLAEGLSNKEIARRLNVSPNTVKTHVSRLYDKLDVERRTQAVDAARRLSLIP